LTKKIRRIQFYVEKLSDHLIIDSFFFDKN
jgi:hypothetical protein